MAQPITPPPMMTMSAFSGILFPHLGDVDILVIGHIVNLGLDPTFLGVRFQVSAQP
jgi:hypothetical protein